MRRFHRFTVRAVGRTSLLALLFAAVLLVPAVALSGSTEKPPQPAQAGNEPKSVPPGLAKEDGQPADPAKPATPAKPAKAAEPAKPAKAEDNKPVKAAKPAKTTKAANPAKAAKPASSGKSAEAQHHVIICHRTGSTKNPYVVINVSVRAWVHGHQTHPMIDDRADIELKNPARPGEKMPTAACTAGANSTNEVKNGILVIDPTSPTVGLPATTLVDRPLAIVVHTTPNATVSIEGAGVLGVTSTTGNARGVARLNVTPTRSGVLGVMVDQRRVKNVGVLGAQASGAQLTG